MYRTDNNRLLILLIIGLAVIATVHAELKMVNVLFRHGDRTPDNNGYEMYPNDPYIKYDFYPMGLGQLTNSGKRREYKIGEMLRSRYDKFLGKIYSPETVSAFSSDYDRTKMSLELVLAGLFPPAAIQRWNPNLNWQPVSTRYVKRIDDNFFLSDSCPLYKAYYEQVLALPEVKKGLSKFNDLMKYLTVKTGSNITKPLDLFYLYHTFMSEYSMGLSLPDWVGDLFPYGELWNGTVFAYDVANYNIRLRRLYAGPYIRTINADMQAYANGSVENLKKIYLYSGHETNIAALLYALGIFFPHVPEYSSSIITELHQIDGKYYVKVLYYLGIPTKVQEMQLPGCEVLCPFEKYLKLTADVIPSDEELICDKHLTTDYVNYRTKGGVETMTYNLIKTAKSVERFQ